MKFEIRVYDYDDNGNEVDVSKGTFDNRSAAADYVMKFQAEPIEYGLNDSIGQLPMRPIAKGTHVMTIEEWIENVESGMFMASDGIGYYATKTHESNIEIDFFEFIEEYDPRFTHVTWYNK